MSPFLERTLANGLKLEFYDRSNRYYGDYHRVCVEVRLIAGSAADCLPADVCTETHSLVRMAIPGALLLATRDQLVGDFLASTLEYLSRTDFPQRMLLAASATRRNGLFTPRHEY